MRNRCIVCRKPYYRRNMTIVWTQVAKGRWQQSIAKGHPTCLRIFARVSRLWSRSA